jgi:hypothetical protein
MKSTFTLRSLKHETRYQTKVDRAVSKFENQKKPRWVMQMDVLHQAMTLCPKNGKDWLTLCSIEGQATLTQNFSEKQVTLITTIYMRYA